MEIITSETRTHKRADPAYFTGTVWQEPVIEAPEPARVRALRVTFEPGAHADLWAAILYSQAAGRAVASALEERPHLLGLEIGELCATLATFEAVGRGGAGRVAAVMGLLGHVQRIDARSSS